MNQIDQLFARAEPLQLGYANRILLVLSALLLAACAWASWATLDEQIRAPGTVIVSSRAQIVQVVDGGVLKKLKVREGDQVKAGDLLAELDRARFEASTDEIRAKVIALTANIERARAELDGTPLKFSKEVQQYADIVASQRNLYDRRLQLQREELGAIQRSLKLASDELAALERLAKTGDASETEVLRSRRQVNELRGTMDNKRNGYRQEAQTDLAKSQADLEQAQEVLSQRREALQSTQLRAPMSGTVNNVRMTTIGAVMKAGDELLSITPSDDPLVVEAKVTPADVAFIRKDLHANVKLDAYDYTIYGSLKGHVTYISSDTLQENTPKGEQTYYRVHIQIDEIPADRAHKIEVLPGMTTKVEIITGERTVAQYLLKPLRRVSSEALVER